MADMDNKNRKDEIAAMRNKKKRQKNVRLALILAALGAAAIVATVLAVNLRGFSSYKTVGGQDVIKQDEPGAVYASYKNGYIRSSHSGVEYVDAGGNTRWNEPVTFSDPKILVYGDMILVADIGGNSVEIFNESGHTGKVESPYSIYDAAGTASGRVAIMTRDNNANYLELYEPDGEAIYSVKTALGGDGYPLAFDVNSDGSRLAVSYVKAEKKPVETGLRVYDFSGGKDSGDNRVLGEFSDFDGELTGDICFFDNGTFAAVSENTVKFYSDKGKGVSLKSEHELFEDYDGTVKRVLKSGDKLALILSVNDAEAPERLVIFDANGRLACDTELTEGYDKYVLEDDRIIMTSPFRFAVYSSTGKEVTKQTSDKQISAIIGNGSGSNFFLVSEGNVERIKLS